MLAGSEKRPMRQSAISSSGRIIRTGVDLECSGLESVEYLGLSRDQQNAICMAVARNDRLRRKTSAKITKVPASLKDAPVDDAPTPLAPYPFPIEEYVLVKDRLNHEASNTQKEESNTRNLKSLLQTRRTSTIALTNLGIASIVRDHAPGLLMNDTDMLKDDVLTRATQLDPSQKYSHLLDGRFQVRDESAAPVSSRRTYVEENGPVKNLYQVLSGLQHFVVEVLDKPPILDPKIHTPVKSHGSVNVLLGDNQTSTSANPDSVLELTTASPEAKSTHPEILEFDVLFNALKPTVLEGRRPLKLRVTHERYAESAEASVPSGKRGSSIPAIKIEERSHRTQAIRTAPTMSTQRHDKKPHYGAWYIPPAKWNQLCSQEKLRDSGEEEPYMKRVIKSAPSRQLPALAVEDRKVYTATSRPFQ
ncbi:hypothetical protein BJ742DRAFT_828498 [Cladochytrium replicatum]|nr:hypothetical protein BJ742DRAFT_828498 [Cladochytrium replicatum]